jgi:type II secretion system protein N
VMNSIVIFFRFLFRHKWKIMLTVSLTLFFLVFLFPLSDLNDYVSTQVSKLTRNTVFLQFDQMHLSPLTTSVSFEKVYVETPQISSLTSEELSFSPSIAALISRKPGGTVTAKGFLKGEVEVSLHPAKSNTPGIDKSKVDIVASNINLKDARLAANLSLPIEGQLNLTSTAVADLTMTEQPELDLNLSVLKFKMASTSLSLRDLGQINLPEIKLGKIELKGRLANGKFQIENGKLGTSQDEFYRDVKGDLALTFQNIQGQIVPVIGAYNISLDLKATAAFKEKAKFFLTFLDGYKIESGSTTNYKFKIQATAMGMPPQFTPLK